MARYYAVEIKVDGRRYTGDWSLLMGGRMCVRSAFGGVTVEIGQEEPKSAAQLVLERIVSDYHKAQAEEIERQEREMAKLRRPRRGNRPRDPQA
jgi:hypothetical protein